MRVKPTNLLTTAAAGLLVAFGAGDLAAQEPQPQQAPDPPDREELVTFTEAYVAIAEVRAEVTPAISAAEDAEEATRIQEEANQQMMAILDEHDLDAERYGEITMVLNTDEELRAEFEAIYEELTEGGGGPGR
jgi:hypothetical protein